MRFDKSTHYCLHASKFKDGIRYERRRSLVTLVDGAHGVLWHDGELRCLRSTKLIGDGKGILRDKHGLRLKSRTEKQTPPKDFLNYWIYQCARQIDLWGNPAKNFQYEQPSGTLGWIATKGVAHRFFGALGF